MNFFKDPTSTVDDNIRNTYYPDMSSDADGIDLRIEMNRILYGSQFKKPLGHWVVLRIFKNDTKSKYFNIYTKEGIMGPSHDYIDIVLRSRRVPVRINRTDLEDEKSGNINQLTYTYYFEWNIPITPGDQIYELNVKDHTTKPTEYSFVEKYDISQVHPFRLENGNIQYLEVIGKFNNITY